MSGESDEELEKRLPRELLPRVRAIRRIEAQITVLREESDALMRSLPNKPPTAEQQAEFDALDAMSVEEKAKLERRIKRATARHRQRKDKDASRDPKIDLILDELVRQERIRELEAKLMAAFDQLTADEVDLRARMALRVAKTANYWTNLSAKARANLTRKEKAEMTKFLNRWNAGEKEVWLALLPAEVRRQYE